MRVACLLLLVALPVPALADDGRTDEGDGMAMRMEVPRGFLNLTNASVLASPGLPAALKSDLPGKPRPITWPMPEGPVVVLGLPGEDEAARSVMEAFALLDDADELAGGYDIWAWDAGGRPMVVVLAADAAALFGARFEFEQSAPPEMVNPTMRMVDIKGSDGSSGVLVREGHRRHRPQSVIRGWAPTHPLTMADAYACAGAHINRLWLSPLRIKQKASQRAVRRARDFGVEPILFWWGRTAPNKTTIARAKAVGVRRVAVLDTLSAALVDTSLQLLGADEALLYARKPHKQHLHRLTSRDGHLVLALDRLNHLRRVEPSFVPRRSNPHGRGSILEGDRYELERLAALWDPAHEVPDVIAEVAKCFPVTIEEPAPYLRKAAAAVRQAQPERPWHASIAKHLEHAATTNNVVLVPVVPAATQIDDAPTLDEPAWAYAARRETKAFDVLAVSDGECLRVAVRMRKAGIVGVSLRPPDRLPLSAVPPVVRKSDGQRVHVFRFTPSDLRGTAHVGRVLHLKVDTRDANEAIGLVVTP